MTRYAIYFVPSRASSLYRFGASVLGYDAYTGENIPFPSHPLFASETPWELSSEPRRYGFHATLKPPFALAGNNVEADLMRHARTVLAGLEAVPLGPIFIAELGAFLALRPRAESAALRKLADTCVTAFEPFRAPLTAVDRGRRLGSSLTERQAANLDSWGYPYLFEDFRFHMTLTGRLPDQSRPRVREALEELFAPIDERVDIDAVCILRQADRSSAFVVLERVALSGGKEPA